MAPLPPNSTIRYYFDYSCDNVEHTVQMRSSGGATDADAFDAFQQVCFAIEPLFALCSLTGIRKSAAGSNISLPILGGSTFTWGDGDQSNVNRPAFLSFVGRSQETGRRVRIFFYGLTGVSQEDYRIQAEESVPIQNALNELNALTDLWVAIDGEPAIWNPYGNVAFSAYWQRQARQGI